MTSLAQQLKQLAVPQTQSLLGQDTYKASFIFDPKEAASKDRETFFCIGTNGFEELCSLDDGFVEYESSLFSRSAVWFERSIQTQEVNEKLDKTLDSFLMRLSPFLQLSSAKKCLEWLINRYRIHLNNVESLMRCFLPYHQTELFIKMLQLLKLNTHSNRKWEWLQSVQKNAVPLTRQVLVNHCRTNPAFLSVITEMVPSYITVFDKDSKSRSERLRVVFDFYAYTMIAVLDAGPVSEGIISAILPVLIRGLKSDFAAYKATSYGILSKILHKSTLKTSLVETLMNAACKNLVGELSRETVLVLLLIFQTQNIEKLSKKTFKHIAQLPTLAPILGTLSSKYQASRFVAALLQRLIPAAVRQTALDIVSSSSSSSYSSDGEDGSNLAGLHLMSIVYDIVSGVTMDTETITLTARLLLENFVQHCGSDAVDQKEAVSQVKKVVRIFETRYPDCLDAAVDIVMTSSTSKKEKQVVKQFLNLSVSSVQHRLVPNSNATLALCLHHRNFFVRLNAVSYVLDNLDAMDDKQSVKETFLVRLNDDSAAVVKRLLMDPQKLRSVFDNEQELQTALLAKLRCESRSVHKLELTSQLVEVLMGGSVTNTMQAVAISYLLILSPQLPYLRMVVSILSSPLAASDNLLSHVSRAWLPKVKDALSKVDDNEIKAAQLSSLNTALVESLSAGVAKHSSLDMIVSLHEQMDALPELCRKSLAYLLCEISLCLMESKKNDLLISLQFQFIHMFKDFMFEKKLMSMHQPKESSGEGVITQLARNHHLPASWWLAKLKTWITSLEVPGKLKEVEFWHEIEVSSTEGSWLQAVVIASDLLFKLNADDRIKNSIQSLIDGLPKVFGTKTLYHRLLCVLCSGEMCKELGITTSLQDRSLQLFKSHFAASKGADAAAVLQSPTPVLPCLLSLCGYEVDTVRQLALAILKTLSEKCSDGSVLYKPVVEALMHYQQEISVDFSYISLALEMLKSKSKRKTKQAEVLTTLLQVAESQNTPCFITAAILQAVSRLDSMEALTPLLPLLSRLLKEESPSARKTDVMHLMLMRFTPSVAGDLCSDSPALELLTAAIRHRGKLAGGSSVQEIAIQQITKGFFASLPSLESQLKVAEALLDVLQDTTETAVASIIRKVFRHVSLPADLLSEELAPILQSASSSVREIKRQRRLENEETQTFESPAWIRITILLEIMQTKKKIPDGNKLVPVCFQILTKVLEVENAGEAEYLKQLILGVIHNLCHRKLEITDAVNREHLNLDAIVQCIRTSHNPHTHQQSLLVLSVAAQIAPEQLLHSMMSVFTFMGANILRQDDSYSFQVITRILETVFPALVMACGKDEEHSVSDMVTLILRVFVDAYPHIPVHRKLMVFTKLLHVIGVDQYMWRLLLVFIEGVAVRSKTTFIPGISTESDTGSRDMEARSKAIDQVHVEFLISLVLEFSPLCCLRMADQALKYLAQLPDDKKDTRQTERSVPKSVVDATKEEREIFSLAFHNSKQLHKFKHATVLTLFHLMSNRNFIALVAEKLDAEIMTAVKQLLETLLAYTTNTSRAVERYAGTPHADYWKGLLTKCNNLLDSLVSLLPQDQFLQVVSGLLDSPVVSVQRKAMELLVTRLKHTKDFGTSQQVSVLLEMVYKLQKCVELVKKTDTSADAEERAANGKLALYTLMLLCRVLGTNHHVTFLEVLKQVCEVLACEDIEVDASATAMICCAEIISCVRAHAIVFMPRIMPHILKQLKDANLHENDLLPSCVMSIHKIMDTLPNFLTPYLKEILTQVCHLLTMLGEAPASEQREQVLKSLRHTGKSLAALPTRIFLPEVTSCFVFLLETERQESIANLLSVVSQHVSGMSREDLSASHHKLLTFFLTALDFRVTQCKLVNKDTIEKIESAVIETILVMVLKMAEGTFRPMLLTMFEWATQQGADRDRIITFYHLADSLAGRLKGIFLLFAAHIIQHAAQMLVQLKSPTGGKGHSGQADESVEEAGQSRKKKSFFKKDKNGSKASQALTYILGCIERICLYDTQNFINKDRFAKLMEPLLDQIDNMVGGEEMYQQRIQKSVVPAIANFAAATKNDALWKDLNFQLMQKTRNKNKQVKMSALCVLKEMHKKLGEDYLILLPETIPFLSELMEDDCEDVEKLTQEVLHEMEQTLGEPLQGYLS